MAKHPYSRKGRSVDPSQPRRTSATRRDAIAHALWDNGEDGGTGTAGKDAIPILLKNTTRQRQIPVIGTLDAAAAPSSTDTVNMKVTIGSAKNWVTGTRVTVNSTANGLTAGTEYYLGRFSSTVFAFYTAVQNAVDDVSRVTLTGSISATITPDAVVFATIPTTAYAAALASFRNEGQGGNWLVRFAGLAPTTSVYSAKIGPGDSTLGTLGEGYSEEDPPIGDICVFHDDPTNVNAGILAAYVGWNDGTSPLAGATGPAGSAGRGYQATSTTSIANGNSGSKTLVTQTNLAYTVGARVRATSRSTGHYMEGVVTGYTEFSVSANLVFTADLSDGNTSTLSDWDINLAGQQGVQGIQGLTGNTGPTGPAGTGGSPSVNDFRLTLAPGNPVYRPLTATPSSTDTTAETCTFASAHGWVTGTIVTVSATVGGLTAGTRYYLNALSTTTCSFYTTLANAIADTSRVNLTASITSAVIPSGISNTTIYCSPHVGNTLFTYDSGTWTNHTSAEFSLALGTLTSGKNYDVFVYNNSGTLTLELSSAWSGDNARTDALARQDGIWVKSSDHARRYIGTIRTDSTTTTIDDEGGLFTQTGGKRFVWNLYNQVLTDLVVIDTTATWNYTLTPYRQANAATGNKVEFVTGLALDNVSANLLVYVAASASVLVSVGIGVDSTTINSARQYGGTALTTQTLVTATLSGVFSIGYHALNWLEASTASGTTTWVGLNSTAGTQRQSGMTAQIKG